MPVGPVGPMFPVGPKSPVDPVFPVDPEALLETPAPPAATARPISPATLLPINPSAFKSSTPIPSVKSILDAILSLYSVGVNFGGAILGARPTSL